MNSLAAALSNRHRLRQALAMTIVVSAGLLWRSPWLGLPELPRKYGGDALWALLVFFGFGFLLPRRPTRAIALLAMTFSGLIEFSQLYHAPWIDSIRATRLGALVLGSVFNWPDFSAYGLGIATGVLCEWLLAKRSWPDQPLASTHRDSIPDHQDRSAGRVTEHQAPPSDCES